MKVLKNVLTLTFVCIVSFSCYAQADSNKVTRNTLVGAIRKIQADSIQIDSLAAIEVSSAINDTLSCNSKTTSIVIYVSNTDLDNDKPYSLTFTKNGILLEVFSEGLVVYRGAFEYKGTSYKKLLSRINMQQIVRVAPYGKESKGARSITFSAYRNDECIFTANDNAGVLNVKGNFYPLISYMECLVPDLQKIIDNCEDATIDNDKRSK